MMNVNLSPERKAQRDKAKHFYDLHHAPGILILPNAWDAASAKMFELAGFHGVAGTSAGIANAWGYPDGEIMPRGEMLLAMSRIAHSVAVPVTADMERGFGRTSEEVAETARLTLESGAVGINLEDSTGDPARPLADIAAQVETIYAVRQAADEYGVPLLINARVDVYAELGHDDGTFLSQAIRRGNAYREAGADCIFMMSVDSKKIIGELVREIDAPINILARGGSPTIAELEQLGVARVTFGSIPMRAAMSFTGRLAEAIKNGGDYDFARNIVTYPEANGYFE